MSQVNTEQISQEVSQKETNETTVEVSGSQEVSPASQKEDVLTQTSEAEPETDELKRGASQLSQSSQEAPAKKAKEVTAEGDSAVTPDVVADA